MPFCIEPAPSRGAAHRLAPHDKPEIFAFLIDKIAELIGAVYEAALCDVRCDEVPILELTVRFHLLRHDGIHRGEHLAIPMLLLFDLPVDAGKNANALVGAMCIEVRFGSTFIIHIIKGFGIFKRKTRALLHFVNCRTVTQINGKPLPFL